MKRTFILDPGHGMSNRKRGVYDPGAVADGVTEAEIALAWANELRSILIARKHTVVRTRVDAKDPCPVWRRDDIARSYGGEMMISLHCNAANGKASGSEVYYRGGDDKSLATKLSAAAAKALGTKNRGAKMESQSQHSALAVMEFDKCWLIEIGFIDHPGDRAAMLNPTVRKKACEAIADKLITTP
jgi:N-acetylmuramoyl-L-alanine amidase